MIFVKGWGYICWGRILESVWKLNYFFVTDYLGGMTPEDYRIGAGGGTFATVSSCGAKEKLLRLMRYDKRDPLDDIELEHSS